MTTTENIRKELQDLVDSKYQEFHSALVPGIGNILGVRIPQLRILAKEIAKRDNWRMFVEATDTKFYEETMLQGMVIGLAKMELDERMKHISMFVPRIDNWAVCDIFCGELKTAEERKRNCMAVYPALPHISQRVRNPLRDCDAFPLCRRRTYRRITGIRRHFQPRCLLCTYGYGLDDIHLFHQIPRKDNGVP